MASNENSLYSNKGKITCDRNILLSIISLATKEISGVSALENTFAMNAKRFFKKSDSNGVSLKFNPNGKIIVDVYIRILSGYSVPEIAFKVQENIKNNIVSMVEMRASKINVHVVGVDFVQESKVNK